MKTAYHGPKVKFPVLVTVVERAGGVLDAAAAEEVDVEDPTVVVAAASAALVTVTVAVTVVGTQTDSEVVVVAVGGAAVVVVPEEVDEPSAVTPNAALLKNYFDKRKSYKKCGRRELTKHRPQLGQ